MLCATWEGERAKKQAVHRLKAWRLVGDIGYTDTCPNPHSRVPTTYACDFAYWVEMNEYIMHCSSINKCYLQSSQHLPAGGSPGP